MDRDRYNAILRALRAIPISACPYLKALALLHDVPMGTLQSIYSQEVQFKTRVSGGDLRARLPSLITAYLQGTDLLELCWAVDQPPCHVVRQILSTLPLGLKQGNKKAITEILRDPPSLSNSVTPEAAQEALRAGGAADTSPSAAAAFLARLAADVARCVDADGNYGPASDLARHSAGIQYEERLYDALRSAGVAYWTESHLRDSGHHKTPDARLRVPIAAAGRVVCWIDSKATFGDDRQHASYRTEQYDKYSNRYGPGMVIYWHGYLADLQDAEEHVLLREEFPGAGEIVTLPQLPLSLARGEDLGEEGNQGNGEVRIETKDAT